MRLVVLLFCISLLSAAVAQAAQQPAKPRIAVLATGGTIAGAAPSAIQTVGYKAAVVTVDRLLAAVPALTQLVEIKGEQLFQIAGENMTPEHWLKLADRVNILISSPDIDGVVITHGTDTLEETAYFLNLTVKTDKPVVLVGSMRPSTALSADGPLNLYNAAAVAADPASRGKGVLVVLNDTISGAREAAKSSTFSLQTFQSPDMGALGYVQSGRALFYRQSLRRHTKDSVFNAAKLNHLPGVVILYGYAGSEPALVDASVQAGFKGIVYAATGNGSLSDSVKAALHQARKKGVQVVRSSRTGSGPVARNGEVDDDKLGFVASDTLSPQKARILLMLGLTVTSDTKRLQEFFSTY